MANKPLAGKSMAVAKRDTLQGLLESMKGRMQSVLPKHITAERMMRVALVAASKNPKLYECTKESVAKSMMDASELGLEPGGARQLAALVPYGNECQFQPMYKGLIELALRDGRVLSIEAHVVHKNDKFKCQYGSSPILEHEPCWDGDPGNTIAAYAVAMLAGGSRQWEVMTLAELDKVQSTSKAQRSDSPWKLWPDEMRRKTVIKRLVKFLPCSPELAKAIEIDNEATGVIDTEFEVMPDEAELVDKLAPGKHKAKKKAAAKKPEPEPEPESQATTHDFNRNAAENEICNFSESATDEEKASFNRKCIGINVDPAKWIQGTDAQIESILNTVRDLVDNRP